VSFLCNGYQQVGGYCNPDLTVNSVLAGPVKCFDMQVLFDPFEKRLDLPPFPVELCNGQGREIKIVGHEGVDCTGSIVFINDQSDFFGIRFRGFVRSQSHYLVAYQACIHVNLCRGNDLASKVVFGPGYKECTSLMKEGVEPMKNQCIPYPSCSMNLALLALHPAS